jgi:hypothetical protein
MDKQKTRGTEIRSGKRQFSDQDGDGKLTFSATIREIPKLSPCAEAGSPTGKAVLGFEQSWPRFTNLKGFQKFR